jgi:hypothetical protein
MERSAFITDGREALHSEANPPNPMTVTEGWLVDYYSGGNFFCCDTVYAPGSQRLVFAKRIRRSLHRKYGVEQRERVRR